MYAHGIDIHLCNWHRITLMQENAIKSFRKSKGWSQSDLAEALGVDQATVSRAESGKRELPKPAMILFRRMASRQRVAA